MKYDFDNCMLTLDDMTQCNGDIIKSWLEDLTDEDLAGIYSPVDAYNDYVGNTEDEAPGQDREEENTEKSLKTILKEHVDFIDSDGCFGHPEYRYLSFDLLPLEFISIVKKQLSRLHSDGYFDYVEFRYDSMLFCLDCDYEDIFLYYRDHDMFDYPVFRFINGNIPEAPEQDRKEEKNDDLTEDNGSTPENNYDVEIIDDQHTKEYSLSITRDEIDSLRFAILHYRFYLENERKTSLILDESDYEEVTELSNIDRISDKLYKLLDPSFGSTDDDDWPF